MKALDIVRTPGGSIAWVTETNCNGTEASINYIGNTNPKSERNAWWDKNELIVIDSIPHMIATATCHPFGKGDIDVERFFKI